MALYVLLENKSFFGFFTIFAFLLNLQMCPIIFPDIRRHQKSALNKGFLLK